MILINTKNYKTGNALLKLAKLIEGYDIHNTLVVPASEVYRIAARTTLNVFVQHVDAVENEKTTGKISAASVKSAGATGTLLNHSEHPLTTEVIKKTIEQCAKVNLATVICVKTLAEAQTLAQFKPNAIAFEDPALIGTGKSVATYNAHDLQKFVTHLKGKPIVPLCGAGLSTIDDVKKAYALGCKGVLIASAIAQSKNPERFLEQLAQWRRQL
ncbi:MAG: triose-phosphate isomerase [Nanoarchaeota archaeon]